MKEFYSESLKDAKGQKEEIIYEWELDEKQWLESMKPLEKEYRSEFRKKIILYDGVFPVVFLIFAIVVYYRDYAMDGFIAALIMMIIYVLPVTLIVCLQFKRHIHELLHPERRKFFMTKSGMYTGRMFCRQIERYKISDKGCRFSLFITQPGIYPYRDNGASGVMRIWNDFIFNEEDRLSIYTILEEWESDGTKPERESDRRRLHQYLDEPKEQVGSRTGSDKGL